MELPKTGSCKDIKRVKKKKLLFKDPLPIPLKSSRLVSVCLFCSVSCVTRGTPSDLSEPQFPHLETGA